MRNKYRYITGCFLFLIYALPALSQTYTFKTYSIQDGLSQSVVQAMLQSNNGYLWIGTGYGLSRFDGITFKNYFTDQGLIQNRIYTLWQNQNGDIWVGTQKGISVYKDGKFISPKIGINKQLTVPVFDITSDSQGRIWIATEGQGVFYIDKGHLNHIGKEQGLLNDRVRSIVEDDEGNIWLGTRGGVNCLLKNGNMITYTTQKGLVDDHVRDILKDRDGSIWIGTKGGLSHFKNGRFHNYKTTDGLVYDQVRCLLQDKEGYLWIGTEDGLSRFKDGQFTNYTVANGLANNNIYSMLQDEEGDLWFGTYGGGMCRFQGERFTNYTMDNGLSNNLVTAVQEDNNGELLIGTYGGGINLLKDHKIKHFTQENGLIDDRVYNITPMADGSYWISTRDGISIMKDERFLKSTPLPSLPYHKIRCIVKDTSGAYWIGTDDEGIMIVKNHNVRKFQKEDGLAGDNVRSILVANNGDVWVGTLEGVTRLHNGKYSNYTTSDGLIHSGVLDIYQDKKGNIWFATYGGISRFNGNGFNNYIVKNGLRTSVCYTITEDNNGSYWVGTNKGVLKVEPSILNKNSEKTVDLDVPEIKRYTSSLGLVSNEMNWNAIFRDKKGNIWFGSVGGLIKVDPSLVTPNLVGPPVYITNVQVMGKNWNLNKKISVAYDQNFVTINFVGLCFSTPEMVQYEYRLKGVDRNWVTTNKRSVRYSALTDGDYNFQVRARNSDGVWSQESAKISFIIQPPLWESWWFIFLLVIIAIVIIVLIYNNFRVSRLIDIERMRVRIASDLHDDVGSSLTEIALQTDFLQAEDIPENLSDSIKQLGDQSRKVVSTMDDIVWSIDARNDTVGDLTDRMQDYANSVLGRKQILIKYDFHELDSENKSSLSVDLRQNLYLIFKEAINNIAKHSDAKNVYVKLRHSNEHFILTIHDDGKGIDSREKLTGHGLKNMKLRADRINANIEFIPDNGLTIKVTGKGI